MSGSQDGGSCLDSSSENTLQYLQNSSGIPFIEGSVFLLHSLFSQSRARLDRFKKRSTFLGRIPVLEKTLWARLRKPLICLYLVLCSCMPPFASCPFGQSIGGLNSCRKGYPKIIQSCPRSVKKNLCSFSCLLWMTRSQQ
jgi:hypothetical protein